MPPEPRTSTRPTQLSGTFRYPLFSPRGALEGVMIDTPDGSAQVVFDPRDPDASTHFAAVTEGTSLSLEVTLEKSAEKHGHAVYNLHRVPKTNQLPVTYRGAVVRLHYARHGEPNGVVLDTGDFLHLKPDGMVTRKLAIGDKVTATGAARPLAIGTGSVVEVATLDGTPLRT